MLTLLAHVYVQVYSLVSDMTLSHLRHMCCVWHPDRLDLIIEMIDQCQGMTVEQVREAISKSTTSHRLGDIQAATYENYGEQLFPPQSEVKAWVKQIADGGKLKRTARHRATGKAGPGAMAIISSTSISSELREAKHSPSLKEVLDLTSETPSGYPSFSSAAIAAGHRVETDPDRDRHNFIDVDDEKSVTAAVSDPVPGDGNDHRDGPTNKAIMMASEVDIDADVEIIDAKGNDSQSESDESVMIVDRARHRGSDSRDSVTVAGHKRPRSPSTQTSDSDRNDESDRGRSSKAKAKAKAKAKRSKSSQANDASGRAENHSNGSSNSKAANSHHDEMTKRQTAVIEALVKRVMELEQAKFNAWAAAGPGPDAMSSLTPHRPWYVLNEGGIDNPGLLSQIGIGCFLPRSSWPLLEIEIDKHPYKQSAQQCIWKKSAINSSSSKGVEVLDLSVIETETAVQELIRSRVPLSPHLPRPYGHVHVLTKNVCLPKQVNHPWSAASAYAHEWIRGISLGHVVGSVGLAQPAEISLEPDDSERRSWKQKLLAAVFPSTENPLTVRVDIIGQIIAALKHLGEMNIVHLDIKPLNIVISSPAIFQLLWKTVDPDSVSEGEYQQMNVTDQPSMPPPVSAYHRPNIDLMLTLGKGTTKAKLNWSRTKDVNDKHPPLGSVWVQYEANKTLVPDGFSSTLCGPENLKSHYPIEPVHFTPLAATCFCPPHDDHRGSSTHTTSTESDIESDRDHHGTRTVTVPVPGPKRRVVLIDFNTSLITTNGACLLQRIPDRCTESYAEHSWFPLRENRFTYLGAAHSAAVSGENWIMQNETPEAAIARWQYFDIFSLGLVILDTFRIDTLSGDFFTNSKRNGLTHFHHWSLAEIDAGRIPSVSNYFLTLSFTPANALVLNDRPFLLRNRHLIRSLEHNTESFKALLHRMTRPYATPSELENSKWSPQGPQPTLDEINDTLRMMEATHTVDKIDHKLHREYQRRRMPPGPGPAEETGTIASSIGDSAFHAVISYCSAFRHDRTIFSAEQSDALENVTSLRQATALSLCDKDHNWDGICRTHCLAKEAFLSWRNDFNNFRQPGHWNPLDFDIPLSAIASILGLPIRVISDTSGQVESDYDIHPIPRLPDSSPDSDSAVPIASQTDPIAMDLDSTSQVHAEQGQEAAEMATTVPSQPKPSKIFLLHHQYTHRWQATCPLEGN